MHCDCCDKLLTEYEISLKHTVSQEHLNTCLKCLDGLSIPFSGNPSLKGEYKEEKEGTFEEWDEDY